MTASSLPARPGSCSMLSVLPYRDRNIIVWGMDHEEEEMDKDNSIIKTQTPQAGITINKGNKVYVEKE